MLAGCWKNLEENLDPAKNELERLLEALRLNQPSGKRPTT